MAASKDNSTSTRDDAGQVVRQFAWNLAGTFAGAKAGGPKARTVRKRNIRTSTRTSTRKGSSSK